MNINYNDWFYEYQQYLTGKRDNVETFNDTNWKTTHDQLKRLIDLDSSLIHQQPYTVVGNEFGFTQFLSMMENSGYTFEDINEALVETYQQSLRQSMSKMLVNTRAIIYHTDDMTKMYSVGKYYIINISFDQLRFGGERDEFIRQKFHSLNHSDDKTFLTLEEYTSSEYANILKCAFIVSLDGMIWHDVKIGFNDHGLIFKIGFTGSYNPKLIIHKLDDCLVCRGAITSGQLKMYTDDEDGYISIPNITLNSNKLESKRASWRHCIIDFYGTGYPSVPTVPNFGSITRDGRITIAHPQTKTFKQLEQAGIKTYSFIVYIPKFFNEINAIYPAANYMDMIRTSDVYTDADNIVKGRYDRKIVTSGDIKESYMEKCTPPICLDRDYDTHFEDIINCCYIGNVLTSYTPLIRRLMDGLNKRSTIMSSYDEYKNSIRYDLQEMHSALLPYYRSYYTGSMITSLRNEDAYSQLVSFMSGLFKFSHLTEAQFEHYHDYVIKEFYTLYYERFIEAVSAPFYNNETFMNFRDIKDVTKQFYEDEPLSTHYDRNVSEQCFVTLKYSREHGSWLFDCPSIKHFKGIGNTFYINDDLNGDEIFKFFVLYSDTDNPCETNVDDHYSENIILDYDMFTSELDRHVGFIRYWHVENKLLKLSKFMFGKYDDETIINILSKALKNKIDAMELLEEYDSDFNYSPAVMTQYNIDNYTETSEAAPFLLNYLFYALRTLKGSEDLLQSFFYHTLTKNTFIPRYIDYPITDALEDVYMQPSNLTGAVKASDMYDMDKSHPITNQQYEMYYGLPYVFMFRQGLNPVVTDVYSWVAQAIFSVGTQDDNYYLIRNGGVDKSYWLTPRAVYGHTFGYHYADFAYMITKFICCIRDYMSYVLTNYDHAVDQSIVYKQAIQTINDEFNKIKDYYDNLDTLAQSHLRPTYEYLVNNFPYTDIFNNLLSIAQNLVKSDDFYGGSSSKQKYVRQQANWFTTNIRLTQRNVGYYDHTKRRVFKLYDHFKEANTKKNVFQYGRWIDKANYDSSYFQMELFRANPKYNTQVLPEYDQTFGRARKFLSVTNTMSTDVLPTYEQTLTTLKNTENGYLLYLENYCADVLTSQIFDMYVISDIIGFDFGNPVAHDIRYIVWTTTKDEHFVNPESNDTIGGDVNVTFYPILGYENTTMRFVKEVRKPCEYIFFDGTPITNCTFKVYDVTGALVKTITGITVKFTKASSSAAQLSDMKMLPNVGNTPMNFVNTHEDISITNKDMIVNTKHNETNYELLVANHFSTLDKYDELVLNPKTMLQSSRDVVYINNQKLNTMVLNDYSKIHSPKMLFKPSQILHVDIDPETKIATSVAGRLTPGQTVYLSPTSYPQYVFPAIVTTIDHSTKHGMLEAVVDERHSKWFEIKDKTLMQQFLTSPIECKVLDDNLSNLLDEYNGDYDMFCNPNYDYDIQFSDEDMDGMISVPGDPIFVQNNAEYVYTRLEWMFPEEIKTRFIDDEHKKWNFRYLGHSKIVNVNDYIYLNCINHDWSTLTLSEQYPILRSEPNDHAVWNNELKEYQYLIDNKYVPLMNEYIAMYQLAVIKLANATTDYDRDIYEREIASWEAKRVKMVDTIKRLQSYIDEQEHPTTWYNVQSYDAAMEYIDSGKAQALSSTYQPDIRDIIIWPSSPTDQDILIYDWEHKQWVDRSAYRIIPYNDGEYHDDVVDDYKTSSVLYTIRILINSAFPTSNMLFIYLAYKDSTSFDNIRNNSPLCNVRFKPLLSIDHGKTKITNPYDNVKIRKHIDSNEVYTFAPEDYKQPDDFSKNAYHIHRDSHSGRNPYTSALRYCDLKVKHNGTTYTYDQLEVWVRNPFKGSKSTSTVVTPSYACTINQPMNDFKPNETVKLICIENKEVKNTMFNGSISNVVFTARTAGNSSSQQLMITNSNLLDTIEGTFICSVSHDSMYHSNGGLVTVTITSNRENVFDQGKQWIKLSLDTCKYNLLPDEFLITIGGGN